MNDLNLQSFLQQIKQELIEKEIENVETRCSVVNREVNKAINSVLVALNMGDLFSSLKPCCVIVEVKEYTQHIEKWKGLSLSSSSKQELSLKDYQKGAMNWANGRRASILATKVFPRFIAQSVQYCNEVAWHLFASDPNRAHLFFQLCKTAVLLSILKSNVQLNQRSAETPLICQNSVTKYGLDKVLNNYLPENMVTKELISQSGLEGHDMRGVMENGGLLMKSTKKLRHKLQFNVFAAFQKAFTDLYTNLLAEYRQLYVSKENSTEQPSRQPEAQPQSTILELNRLIDQMSQNLHQFPENEIHFLLNKIQQLQQTVELHIVRRSYACTQNIYNNSSPQQRMEVPFDHVGHHINDIVGDESVVHSISPSSMLTEGQSYCCHEENMPTFPNTDFAQRVEKRSFNDFANNELWHCMPSTQCVNSTQANVTPRLTQETELLLDRYYSNSQLPMPCSKRARYNHNDSNTMLGSIDINLFESFNSNRLVQHTNTF